jgi:hypothetical protein
MQVDQLEPKPIRNSFLLKNLIPAPIFDAPSHDVISCTDNCGGFPAFHCMENYLN